MALTTAQKNELATRLIEAQQTNNYGSFNDLVRQLRLTQADFLENFPAINQAGINEQIGRGAVVPTTAPPAVTYTTPQVTNAIRDALNAGFTVQQARQGAMTNFGLSSADFDKALQQVQSTNYNTTFSDARVAQAIQDSLAQGFTVDQARQGALANYGVTDAQFNRALASVSGGTQGMRGSAPLYQFPGLLAGREDMATGAQRFISRAPGSLLFDVPKVEGGQFTFTPGAFDYNAIRNQQAGAGQVDASLLEQAQIQPGTAEYNRLTTPPKTTTTAKTYSDAQVAQALQESMAQGFSLDQSLSGASTKYGISADQLARAQGLLPQQVTTPAVTAAVTPEAPMQAPSSLLATTPTYSNQQIAQAIIDSLGQGFTMDQIQQGAFSNFGVNTDQFNQAAGLLPSMGYTIGQGFR